MVKTKNRSRIKGDKKPNTANKEVPRKEITRSTLTLKGAVDDSVSRLEEVTPILKSESQSSELRHISAPENISVDSDNFPKWCSTQGSWQVMWEAVVGLAHRDSSPPLPCQDAAGAASMPRPVLMIADGAGSSAVSEIGARTVVTATLRLLNTLEHELSVELDFSPLPESSNLHRLAMLIVKHAKGTLVDLAESQRRSVRDFRCTFLVIVVGKARILWIKVGDGAIVIEKIAINSKATTTESFDLFPELVTLGEVGKGEFVNQTVFLDDQLAISDVQWGVFDASSITGIAVMSDGAAEKLVAHDGSRVSAQVSQWLDGLRQGKLRRHTITSVFYSESFTKGSSQDDRSIAMAAADLLIS